MRYEELVQFINELPKTDFFNSPAIEKEYKARIKDFNITQGLLDKLNAEFSQICTMSKEYKNSPKKPSRLQYKYYIRTHNKLTAVYFPN